MNIWHDISPEKITPEHFTAVIEIPKGSKISTSLTRTQAFSDLIEFFIHQLTIPPTTVLFPVPMQMTLTLWIHLLSVLRGFVQ